MLARCFCPKHGKLELDAIQIINGQPICQKCKSVLEFGKVRPRSVEKSSPKKKRKRRRKRKKSTKKSK